MKKTLTILLVFVMLLIPLTGCNNEKSTTTTTNTTPPTTPISDFEYTVRRDGTICISKYIGNDTVVVFPEMIEDRPVTVIASFVLPDDINVEKVYISDSVTTIFDNAFSACSSLQEVVFGKGLLIIEQYAFAKCDSLTKIILPPNLTTVERYAFAECASLREIFIPKTLINIDEAAFFGNHALTSITFEDGLPKIAGFATFQGAISLETVTIPASVTEISTTVFSACPALKSVKFIGDAPAALGEYVFGPPNKEITIYYNPETSGWDTTTLKDDYTLIPY